MTIPNVKLTETAQKIYQEILPKDANKLIQFRVKVCAGCEVLRPIFKSKCPACGCIWNTRIQDETKHCPKNKW